VTERSSPRPPLTGGPPRQEVAACYGHISGLLAERMFTCFLKAGWIEVEHRDGRFFNERLTDSGRSTLLGWGVEVPQLDASQRKAVAACTERRRGQDYQHLGGHLGALVRTWLEREALIAKTATGLAVTDHGRKSLIEAGWLDHTLP